MEETMEKRVWQRVRGTGDLAGELRECLVRQGELLGMYRHLSRRGGRGRQLYEQKMGQIACLRGLLRVLTGQSVAPPPSPDRTPELLSCTSVHRLVCHALWHIIAETFLTSIRYAA